MASAKRSDGEGSISQRHLPTCPPAERVGKVMRRPKHPCAGPWVGTLVTGWRDGKPQRRKVSAKSKADAARKLRELREKIAAGQLPAGRLPTVGEWLTFWLDEIAAAKVRASTLRGYRTYVTQYLVPLLGAHRLDRLRPEHVEAAWKHLLEKGSHDGKPLSSTSAHQAHRILARALKVAQQRGYVQANVATLIDAPQPADVEMTPLMVDEAKKVLAAAAVDRIRARWTVALSLGLRQGEALGLCWDRVDLDEGVIHVRRALSRVSRTEVREWARENGHTVKPRGRIPKAIAEAYAKAHKLEELPGGLVLGPVKSRAGRRDVVMPAELVAQLRAHRVAQAAERLAAGSWWHEGPDGGYVFASPEGMPLDPRADWQAWKDLLAAAKVPTVRLHDARHTAATLLLAQGVPARVVMEILGHSQIGVTSKYQHVVDEMKRDAADRMGSALWGS